MRCVGNDFLCVEHTESMKCVGTVVWRVKLQFCVKMCEVSRHIRGVLN